MVKGWLMEEGVGRAGEIRGEQREEGKRRGSKVVRGGYMRETIMGMAGFYYCIITLFTTGFFL